MKNKTEKAEFIQLTGKELKDHLEYMKSIPEIIKEEKKQAAILNKQFIKALNEDQDYYLAIDRRNVEIAGGWLHYLIDVLHLHEGSVLGLVRSGNNLYLEQDTSKLFVIDLSPETGVRLAHLTDKEIKKHFPKFWETLDTKQ